MGANAKLIQQAYDAFGRGDIATVIGMLDENVEWTSAANLPHGGEFSGPAEVGKFFEGIGANWDTLVLDIESVSDLGTSSVDRHPARRTARTRAASSGATAQRTCSTCGTARSHASANTWTRLVDGASLVHEAVASLPVGRAQLELLQLARRGTGERVAELDRGRALEVREPGAAVLDDLVLGHRRARRARPRARSPSRPTSRAGRRPPRPRRRPGARRCSPRPRSTTRSRRPR